MRMKAGPTALAGALTMALVLAPTPASALAPLPRGAVAAAAPDFGAAAAHSRWDRDRDRDRDRGIGAGDIIAGALVLGAIAAVAGAFDGDERDDVRRYPVDTPRRDDSVESGGLARAVDMCVAEAERGGERVAEVDTATRDAQGWRVTGAMERGTRFDCRIGNDGRIRGIDQGERSVVYAPAGDRQYADAVYARLRSGRDGGYSAPSADFPSPDEYDADPRPAYPGGPLPGEEGYDDYAPRYDPAGYGTPD